MTAIPLSVLDLAPILEGRDRPNPAAQSFRHTRELAQHCEQLGFARFWLAEHHGMPGIASAATAVLMAHVAGHTTRIRVGAGGIMLPNHAPLVIAEQFGTLESLFPGRVDLGLGRAPGTDQITMQALRRNLSADVDQFPQDVLELQRYFMPAQSGQAVQAVPGAGLNVPLWILGSSLFGAQLAAQLGLPFAFASHFASQQMMDAVSLYRRSFRPSAQSNKPYVMLGFNVFAADTDSAAHFIASSMQQAFVRLRRGTPGRFPPPVDNFMASLNAADRGLLDHVLSCSAIGSPAKVQDTVLTFIARTGADELMITSSIYDHRARLRSYEILAEAFSLGRV